MVVPFENYIRSLLSKQGLPHEKKFHTMRIFFPQSMIMALVENMKNSISPSNGLISIYGLGKRQIKSVGENML
jgi:hypothetical protein